jgi:hypothetical protein
VEVAPSPPRPHLWSPRLTENTPVSAGPGATNCHIADVEHAFGIKLDLLGRVTLADGRRRV